MKQRARHYYKKLRATNILSNFFNLSGIQLSNILLLFLTIRIITGNVGVEVFGIIMFAYRFSALAGTVVNYGTGQSGVRDIAFNVADPKALSVVFYNTLWIRAIIFLIFLVGLLGFYWLHVSGYSYLLLAIPIVLAEVFNPLCFFIGIEKLRIFNIYNLVANFIALLAIQLFIKGPTEAGWVNFILGMCNVVAYTVLLIDFKVRYKLSFYIPLKTELTKIGKDNFNLTINNISANLQQSIIIFALRSSDSNLLGAYTLCDRVIGQVRNLLNTIANAIYPNAVNIFKQSADMWNVYRRKTKYLLSGIFFIGALLIFILADFIIYALSKEHNVNAIMILRIMAFVPVISSLNVFNMVDILLKNNTVYLFKISVTLVILSVLVAYAAAKANNYLLVGAFTLVIEISAWVMYEYVIKKSTAKNA